MPVAKGGPKGRPVVPVASAELAQAEHEQAMFQLEYLRADIQIKDAYIAELRRRIHGYHTHASALEQQVVQLQSSLAEARDLRQASQDEIAALQVEAARHRAYQRSIEDNPVVNIGLRARRVMRGLRRRVARR